MRIEIDFDNKVIEVKDSATLGELVDKLKELNLKDWKEYKLKTGVEYIPYPWLPITYITPQPMLPSPWYTTSPYEPPFHITCGAESSTVGGVASISQSITN